MYIMHAVTYVQVNTVMSLVSVGVHCMLLLFVGIKQAENDASYRSITYLHANHRTFGFYLQLT